MYILLHKLHKEGGVKKVQKTVHMVYGRPPLLTKDSSDLLKIILTGILGEVSHNNFTNSYRQ